jgi:hypothetical protein
MRITPGGSFAPNLEKFQVPRRSRGPGVMALQNAPLVLNFFHKSNSAMEVVHVFLPKIVILNISLKDVSHDQNRKPKSIFSS